TFPGNVSAGGSIERAITGARLGLAAQLPAAHGAGQTRWTEGRRSAAADDRIDAPTYRPARVSQRVQTGGALRDDHPAGAFQAVPDRDLAGRGRIEPGDRLVRADEAGALSPEVLNLLLTELVASGRA